MMVAQSAMDHMAHTHIHMYSRVMDNAHILTHIAKGLQIIISVVFLVHHISVVVAANNPTPKPRRKPEERQAVLLIDL